MQFSTFKKCTFLKLTNRDDCHSSRPSADNGGSHKTRSDDALIWITPTLLEQKSAKIETVILD